MQYKAVRKNLTDGLFVMPESRILCTVIRIIIFSFLMYNERNVAKERQGWRIMKNLLDTITSYREARHWSNYDLATHAGMKPTTISTWYRDGITPTLPSLIKICDAFQITLTEFFSVVESGEREPIVLTQEQAEMLEKWSALRPDQQEAVMHLLNTIP